MSNVRLPTVDLPEVIVAKGLPCIPATISDDEVVQVLYVCLKQLFARFSAIDKHENAINNRQMAKAGDSNITPVFKLTDEKRRKLTNRIRRQIGPTAYIAALGVFQKAITFDSKVRKDSPTEQFARFFFALFHSIKKNDAVKDLVKPYCYEMPDELCFVKKTEAHGLPELRAAIDLSQFRLGNELKMDLWTATKRLDDLELAQLQWKVIKAFLHHKLLLGQKEYALVSEKDVEEHLSRIEALTERAQGVEFVA